MVSILVKPMFAGLLLVAAGPQLPQLDIRRTCMNLVVVDELEKCVEDETYAKRKLLKYWERTPLAFKNECLIAPSQPDPSYLFMRDCINNEWMLDKRQN